MKHRFKSDLESLILAALKSGPLHGYGIVKEIRARSEGMFKFGEGQLYPVLHRLEELEMISGEWEMQEGRPPRKLYALTEQGSALLEERKAHWKQYAASVSALFENHDFRKEAKENA